jgi:hypothetical protein
VVRETIYPWIYGEKSAQSMTCLFQNIVHTLENVRLDMV